MPETDFLTVANISLEERGAVVLKNISFEQHAGRKLALAGESGAGKSTLLQVIAGLVQPTGGEVRLAGRRVKGPQNVLVPGHPGIVYLSQKSDLPKSLRVEQVLRYASKRPAAEAQAVYEVCRISPLMARRTDQLSGGEQQRVALARLLLSAPRLLLLDEPFSNLDRTHKQQLQTVIRDVGEELGITCLLVSHDPTDTLPWADELLVLERGHLVQQGPPEQVYRQPVSEYVAALFGDYNRLTGSELRALMGVPRRKLPGSALLVRPESLVLAPDGQPGVAGTVRAVRFMGSFYEAEVQLPVTLLRVRLPAATVAPGAAVMVALAPDAPISFIE
ncbi:ABC transporter ATP-binding protein [Hymenobacter rubripertinctus]|uniref:ABC transporter ATP-binding protein n=1 Tax=Hymenobacter rubripertinctus TaxID=2029981 RepID=A0A418RA59_9BACT|nr:ABC transporter ATP-binding protein [Hymenobacter rubripertinctus]RIY14165.1 ABC transporter ATP-binding protein [Hymenobacter rubripertinctus]